MWEPIITDSPNVSPLDLLWIFLIFFCRQWKNQTNGEASSFLSILSVRKGDSGSYSCRTSQKAQNTVIVHVLNGNGPWLRSIMTWQAQFLIGNGRFTEKLPAAVQHENSAMIGHFLDSWALLSLPFLLPILISRAWIDLIYFLNLHIESYV